MHILKMQNNHSCFIINRAAQSFPSGKKKKLSAKTQELWRYGSNQRWPEKSRLAWRWEETNFITTKQNTRMLKGAI